MNVYNSVFDVNTHNNNIKFVLGKDKVIDINLQPGAYEIPPKISVNNVKFSGLSGFELPENWLAIDDITFKSSIYMITTEDEIGSRIWVEELIERYI